MEAVEKAKSRMKLYPILLAKCSKAAALYAACVARDLNVSKHICNKEFTEFKNCLVKASKEMRTKL
ncbi:uncharacterized protein LOC129612592 [Condylostylus longicornis]|uniref:uncharacterized protein LOC129612592 n=1 Tax=Condylostylus longicornis TaxID=2530218 RepID=UPI00244DEC42|nr:uncharacterized protein LOC129612592 [Condylostylus longicornis]